MTSGPELGWMQIILRIGLVGSSCRDTSAQTSFEYIYLSMGLLQAQDSGPVKVWRWHFVLLPSPFALSCHHWQTYSSSPSSTLTPNLIPVFRQMRQRLNTWTGCNMRAIAVDLGAASRRWCALCDFSATTWLQNNDISAPTQCSGAGDQSGFITAGQTPPDITRRGRREEGGNRRTAAERTETEEGGEIWAPT